MKKLLSILLGASFLFVSACNPVNDGQEENSEDPNVQVEESADAEGSYYENKDFGFRVQYPSDLILDGNGLWTKEDWDFKNSSSEPNCYACKPMVTIQAASLNGLSLEEFIVKDHTLGDSKTLDGTGAFNIEDSSWTYENLTLGTNEFLRVEIPEYYHVIQYYTMNGDTVVSFLMYYEDDDNEAAKDVMTSLEFN